MNVKLYDLPQSITPRPGEEVIAYQGKSRYEGLFIGYNTSDGLIVKSGQDSFFILNNFLQVRPKDPFNRKNPCWEGFFEQDNCTPANEEQKTKIKNLLDTVITPGPSYFEFIYEIWSRGYEVFLVGGSIRDLINNESPKDVDIVTSMPFNLLEPLVISMFGENGFSRHKINGFMSVGFNAANYNERDIYDPLIDVKNFFNFSPGTLDAQFGSNIDFDYKLRDFACNAIYYEPVNSFFLDPSGKGISDAKGKILNIIKDHRIEHPKYKAANITFRFLKFVRKGYIPSEECVASLNTTFKPLFRSIGHIYQMSLFKKHFMKNVPEEEYETVIAEIETIMNKFGYGDIWEQCFSPFKEDLTNG